MNDRHDDDGIEILLRKQFEGPVADDGFCRAVMQRLPPRRRRRTAAWLPWAGVLAGAGACWLSLLYSPLLHAGWQDWRAGQLSGAGLALLLALAGMALLACGWSVAEADDR